MLFSQTAQAFYAPGLPYPSLPDDVVEIDEGTYTFLLAQINDGQVVTRQGSQWRLSPKQVVLTWDDIRAARDSLLAKSDYTQLPDFPGDAAAWAAYRAALRAIPETFATPADVVWPEPPE